ncbi:hypothetical protein GCM10023201_23520 [Actinomycetospora corticicola]|uniref:Uncharacterized protein n=1 Tax=Actinomycetospora corticicola TaxID=663602 RepID=A0A7Y9DR06_9PSEU|nr:hypothetical protein [Actinomycetospora corticicola]NYD33928.1 hypothetical protein [Actinomycetospora corticicola]
MRSVVLRTRQGRPVWQLTTRASTAAVLALVSLAAAGVQVVLFSSPPPWYQVAVVAFWVVVGLAFVASALGTRSRARRRATTPAPPPVDAAPFVPVPVRPARPRRRETDAVAEVGEPTDPVAAPTTTVRPTPAPRRPAVEERTTTVARPTPARRPAAAAPLEERSRTAVRPSPGWRPSPAAEERTTTVSVAQRSATVARGLTAETVAIRDGRVRPAAAPEGRATERVRVGADDRTAARTAAEPSAAPRTTSRRAASERTSSERASAEPTARPTGGGRRRLADESRAAAVPRRGGAAPADAVPSPRPVPSEERPRPSTHRSATTPRPTPARAEATPAAGPVATVTRSAHARRTAAEDRDRPALREEVADARPAHQRHGRASALSAPSAPSEAPVASATKAERAAAPAPTRRREGPPGSTETTAPFGGAMTFGGGAAPAPRTPAAPVPEPATGRHAALVAPSGESARGVAARHAAVATESGRRRAS